MFNTSDTSFTDSDNSSFLLDNEDDTSENIQTSNYITVSELNSFCNFECLNNINIMHVNCRSLKKTQSR